MTIAGALAGLAALLAAAAAATALLGPSPTVTSGLALASAVAAAVAATARPRPPAAPLAAAAEREAAEREAAEARRLAEAAARDAAAAAAAEADRADAETARTRWAAARASALRRLRFAAAVLGKVPVETEEAAFTLMEKLVALRDQSARAADAARSAEAGTADVAAIDSLASGARATIARVRAALTEMKRHDRDATKGLQSLGQELKSGIDLLAGIGEITERSRLIAFNMAIEAARIGEKGRGFRVIVGELRALNDRTADFSKQVSELLGRFKKYNESLVQAAIESSALVAEEVERGVGEEERAIESLLRASTSCVDLSDSVTQAVRAMNRELDGVLESLQFQDITRQMVEGALATIGEAAEDVGGAGGEDARERGNAATEDERRRVEELRSRLLARAKTKGEKEAIMEVST